MNSEAGGPYLLAAIFCERVLQEKDNVLTVVRIIDRLTITAAGLQPPEEMPPSNVSVFLLVILKSGFIRARHTLRIIPTTPSGRTLPEMSAGVLLEGDDRGVNVILNVQLLASEEGVYWFQVLFEEQLLTRVPLRILYQRVTQGGLFEPQ